MKYILKYALRKGSMLKYLRDKTLYRGLDVNWDQRSKMVVACPDNDRIPRISEAGVVRNGILQMHNGIKVGVNSYYGSDNARLLQLNRGVHEPQEELVFQEVLKHLAPGSTMLELGAYWGFYSLWFLKTVPQSRAFLIEPEEANLDAGKSNCALNGVQADFTRAYVGQTSRLGEVPATLCVDDFVKQKRIDRVTILHADIQGHEGQMLYGAAQSFKKRIIDYVFISTHGFKVHLACLEFLNRNDFVILADADKFESYSLDGLIVARRQEMNGCPAVAISTR